jgi:hypothetical protein
MYYLENLTVNEIGFIKELLEEYRSRSQNTAPQPFFYHSLKNKVKRLFKFISYNPLEEATPKKVSQWKRRGYSPFPQKGIKRDNPYITPL